MHERDVTYLDNNATTRPDDRVIDAMTDCLRDTWGNPSSVHRFGQLARKQIDEARGHVAQLVGCLESELLFTGSGTEASNTAIRGLYAARAPRKKIITTTVEHSATRETVQQLQRDGAEVIDIRVDSAGQLDLDQLSAALTEDVALATILWANNETGVLVDIERVMELATRARVPVHVDITQAAGKVPVSVQQMGCACATIAGHKFHGPKGAGALFVKRGIRIKPFITGGPQERGRRGGTENVAGIVGMGIAAKVARDSLGEMPRVARMRDRLERKILERIDIARVNGDVNARLPNTTNIGFHRLEAEPILLLLSERGICASAGAACSSGSLEPSHVLRAMYVDPLYAHGSIRFSLSRFNTDADVDRCMEVLPGVIERLRKVLPV
jgi:cysteine desulfurase